MKGEGGREKNVHKEELGRRWEVKLVVKVIPHPPWFGHTLMTLLAVVSPSVPPSSSPPATTSNVLLLKAGKWALTTLCIAVLFSLSQSAYTQSYTVKSMMYSASTWRSQHY